MKSSMCIWPLNCGKIHTKSEIASHTHTARKLLLVGIGQWPRNVNIHKSELKVQRVSDDKSASEALEIVVDKYSFLVPWIDVDKSVPMAL